MINNYIQHNIIRHNILNSFLINLNNSSFFIILINKNLLLFNFSIKKMQKIPIYIGIFV
jgi:hypothetical protein